MSDSMKAQGADDSPTATHETTTRGLLPGSPRAHKNDCTHTYADDPLNRIDSETSPSAGWRATYAAMDCSTRQHEGR